jgi:hypothetical protein
MSKRAAPQQDLAWKTSFLRALEALQLTERAGEQGERRESARQPLTCRPARCVTHADRLLPHATAGNPSHLGSLLVEKQPQLALLHLFRVAFGRVVHVFVVADTPQDTAAEPGASGQPSSQKAPNSQRRPKLPLPVADDLLNGSPSNPGPSAELVATYTKRALSSIGSEATQVTQV